MRRFARELFHMKEKEEHHHRHQNHHDHHQEQEHKQHHHESSRPPRMVFAHYMVGLTYDQTLQDWTHDIRAAQAACIDGFALNIGPHDPYTLTQLRFAFEAAEALYRERQSGSDEPQKQQQQQQQRQQPPFVLFLSFDMAAGEWSVEQVVELINELKQSPVYYHRVEEKEDGAGCRRRAMVSTFEGPGWAENWAIVRREIENRDGDDGGIFLVPDWSSLGPHGVAGKLGLIDGAFSWAAWPRAGEERMSVGEDREYLRVLKGKEKVYMAGVSPWFYTRLPQWNKNWYSSSETLWYDRWMQIFELQPDYVQLITWNDYGESSYICDAPHRPSQVVPGAETYVTNHSHAAFRATLPYLIQVYKAGGFHSGDYAAPEQDYALAWYRTTLARCGPDGGTVWGQAGTQSAAAGARDVISVLAITKSPTTVSIRIGDEDGVDNNPSSPSSSTLLREINTHTGLGQHANKYISFHEVPLDGKTGAVMISMHGRTATGLAVRGACREEGFVEFNCVAVGV